MRKGKLTRGPRKANIRLQVQEDLEALQSTKSVSYQYQTTESSEEESIPHQAVFEIATRGEAKEKEKELKQLEQTVKANLTKDLTKDFSEMFASINTTLENNL